MNNLESPVIYVAKRNKEILGSTSIYSDLSLTFNLNAYQTISFTIPRDVDGVKQENFDLFEEDALVMIHGVSWYKIHVETNIESTGITKSITGNSLECMLCNKRLVDFQANSDDAEEEGAVAIKFYDATNPDASLLNKILNVSPTWTVGHVDDVLCNKLRIFDVSDTDVYSFLTGDVSEAFNCLFIFDTFNYTVNAYDLDNYGTNTNIYVSMDNLAESMTETIDENSIITCYRVTGGDDIDISEINPNGTKKIYNFEYYIPQFTASLQTKIKDYNTKYQSLKPTYEEVVARLQAKIEQIQELYTRTPSSTASTDWTTYGLYMLQSREKAYQNVNDVYVAQGMNDPESFQYNLYLENLKLLNAVKAELDVRQTEVDTASSEYKSILQELVAIQSELDMDKWFTKDEWIELDSYVVEESYSDDNYSVTDNTTESELFSMEKQLFDAASKDLEKKCRPQYQYSSTLTNVLTIPEFKDFVQYFELGNFIMLRTDDDTLVKVRLISFTVDYSSTNNISVTFSDATRVHDVYEDAASIQAQANSAAMSFQFNKNQYDKSVSQGNFVAEMRKNGLDVATTQIHNASNQNQIWDETGMTFREWNEEKQAYNPEQMKIINNMIVFSDDSFNSSRMAVGKIALNNGEYAYGLCGEAIIGKLFLGEYLTLENDSGTYKFDDTGFSATNGTNTISIQPGGDELFSIENSSEKLFYIDTDGNLHFKGDLTGATGTFSGTISGGSINIGDGTFTVDSDGVMTAKSGTFSGAISGGTISGSAISGGSISGSTISGGVVSGGTISGATISGSSIESYDSSKNSSIKMADGMIRFQVSEDTFTCINMYQENKYLSRLTPYRLWLQDLVSDAGLGIYADKIVFDGSDLTKITNTSIYTHDLEVRDEITLQERYGAASGTSNALVYITGNSGDRADIASTGYVIDYVKGNCLTSSALSGYAKTTDIPAAGIYVNAGGSTTGSAGSYTSNYYLNVGSGGQKTSVSARTVLLSDRRKKECITDAQDISNAYMRLKPVHFKFRDDAEGTDAHWHYGFIAQDVKEAFDLAGIDTYGEELVGCDTKKDEWLLDKEEMHAMHVQMIQKQQREIDQLKLELMELKEKINGSTN